MRVKVLEVAALCVIVVPVAAQADDPNDPAMRDAGYAQGWCDARGRYSARGDDAPASDYAREQARGGFSPPRLPIIWR